MGKIYNVNNCKLIPLDPHRAQRWVVVNKIMKSLVP